MCTSNSSESSPIDNPREEVIADPVVVAENLGKTYTITGAAAEGEGHRIGRRDVRHVDALRGVSFVARRGESIGIIGRNGSGKSTLLNLIAGGEAPTSGKISVAHQPSLLGVTPALQGWLTGEQNTYLGLLALGMSPQQAKEKIPEIVEWAELGEAATRPMSTYSSGMGAKLSFAISTAIQPEILLVDETLSTGDAAFADKARERMQALLGTTGNIFLVSHSLSIVRENCSRAIWIHRGDVIADGGSEEVIEGYSAFSDALKSGKDDEADQVLARHRSRSPEVNLVSMSGD